MPIYEYACPKCGEKVEEVCKVSERMNRLECPKCGACMILEVSKTSFTLKDGGVGWAKDNYSRS